MSSPLRSKKRGNTIIWILMGMLILGLGGFGATNFGGSVRSLGTVGERDIDLRDYARTLNREIAALSAQIGQPVSFEQAQTLGIDRQVQAQVFGAAALDNEADRIGLSVGDEAVRRRILSIQAFEGLDGSFDRDAYALTLRREGLSENEFEAKLRDEAARELLQRAVLGATAAPRTFVDRTNAWLHETRDFALAELTAADLAEPVPAPSEAEIQAHYEANPDAFTAPEARRITYVWLSPDMLADEVVLDEAALRAAYEERIDEYVTPEQRLVERLVYPDEASAAEARARYDAGGVSFEQLAAERGLSLADIDLGEQSQADLGAAGEAVFALEAPGVAGPIQSDLGPALYAMNGILDAREVSFEEARDDLAAEAAADSARRLIAEKSDAIEDLLASGATLEEVAGEQGMDLGQIAYSEGTDEAIAGYPAFREAAAAATEQDFPELVALDDGGVFALRLDGIDPPALKPLDEVRDEAAEGWTREETHGRLLALAGTLKERVDGGAALESTGVVATRYQGFARDGFIADTPPAVAQTVFRTEEGEAAVVDSGGRVFLLALTAVHEADPDSAEVAQTEEALEAQIGQSISEDMFQLYTQAVQNAAGIRIDAAALNAVHAQMN